MADEDKKVIEKEAQARVEETERFFNEPDPVEEGEEPDGPSEDDIVAMQDALDAETRGDESEELEQAKPEKKEDAEPPKTKTKVEDAPEKLDLEEPPPKETEESEISEDDSVTEEQPAVAETDFKPIKVTFVANKEERTQDIGSIQDLQKLCSKAAGLDRRLSDTHTELQTVTTELEKSREANRKTVSAYRRQEYQDEELQPFFDIFRKYPEMRQAFLNDAKWGPMLASRGVKGSAVTHDPERAGHDFDVREREAAVSVEEEKTLSKEVLGKFAEEYDIDGDTLLVVLDHAIENGFLKNDGRTRTRDQVGNYWRGGLERSYGFLARKGEIKTPAVKTAEKKGDATEREIQQVRKMSEDHRSAPGAGGTSQTPIRKELEHIEGETSEDRNRRWLEANPDDARELDQALRR